MVLGLEMDSLVYSSLTSFQETQQHIFSCDVILNKLGLSSAGAEYNDLFTSLKHQRKALEYFENIQEILNEHPI